jgi:hypothetical protein
MLAGVGVHRQARVGRPAQDAAIATRQAASRPASIPAPTAVPPRLAPRAVARRCRRSAPDGGRSPIPTNDRHASAGPRRKTRPQQGAQWPLSHRSDSYTTQPAARPRRVGRRNQYGARSCHLSPAAHSTGAGPSQRSSHGQAAAPFTRTDARTRGRGPNATNPALCGRRLAPAVCGPSDDPRQAAQFAPGAATAAALTRKAAAHPLTRRRSGRREAPGSVRLVLARLVPVSSRRRVDPCMRFSRTRLTDVLHRRHSTLPASPGRGWV